MEFDSCQPYFFNDFDSQEDFYKSTAPSEDIWKKFELLPTPPMSPERTLSGAAPPLSPGDRLSWLSKVLGQDDECEGHFLPGSGKLFGNLSSIIIQDCMWSSFPDGKHPEQLSKGRGSSASPVTQISVRPSRAQCLSPAGALAGGGLATPAPACVDPAAVLTIPCCSSSSSSSSSTIPSSSSCSLRKAAASSGSESRSDSSDDEEEIDVVTVESKQNRAQLLNVRKPVTVTVRADPCPKRFHMSVHRQQHNYAARSPDSDREPEEEDEEEEGEESDEEPQSKRAYAAYGQHAGFSPRSSLSASSSETSQNSDAEDSDRRRNHNFLERKRRNDLRSRFFALRNNIPGLESAKTPKVAILTHATEYCVELHNEERRLFRKKKHLTSRQQQLYRRISELKRS